MMAVGMDRTDIGACDELRNGNDWEGNDSIFVCPRCLRTGWNRTAVTTDWNRTVALPVQRTGITV